jgi:acetyl-CoA acetyltransferase family protein
MREAVVVDHVRTPFGRAGVRGVFREITHVELMVPLFKAIVERNKLDPSLIDEVHIGSVGLAGALTKARTYMFEAGFPDTIWGTDVNTQCASALQTVVEACQAVMCGSADIILAGGIETMDRVGPVSPEEAAGQPGPGLAAFAPKVSEMPYPEGWKEAELLPQWFRIKAPWIMNMGMTAEKLSEVFKVSREDADKFALRSQQKAVAAQDAGRFNDEIIPITVKYKDGSTKVVDKDQGPRRETSLEALAQLRGAYKEGGLVTAGNSCPRNDGGTLCLIMSKEKARELGLKPLVTYRASATVGVDPEIMGIGPLYATRKLLQRTGMSIDDFDLIEINEAFACQVVASGRELKFKDKHWERLNVNGGAIALGHPLGATGARLVGTIGFELRRRNARWGLTTLCQGSGMGYAAAWEREDYK